MSVDLLAVKMQVRWVGKYPRNPETRQGRATTPRVTQQVGMSDDSSWSLDVTKTYHPSRMKFSNKILGGDQSLSMNTTDAITKAESI